MHKSTVANNLLLDAPYASFLHSSAFAIAFAIFASSQKRDLKTAPVWPLWWLQVVQLPLCTVLLMDDRRYPWLVLVPRKVGKIYT